MTRFKPGDLVKCIGRQRIAGNNQVLPINQIYMVSISEDKELELKGYAGTVFGDWAFMSVNPNTVTKLERAIYGLPE